MHDAAPLRAARNACELVLLALRSLPFDFDRQAVAQRLYGAIENLYAALDTRPEAPAHQDGLSTAAARIDEARALLAKAAGTAGAPALDKALQPLDNARRLLAHRLVELGDWTVRHLDEIRRAAWQGRGADDEREPPPFQASVGVPRLHRLQRSKVVAAVDVEPLEPLPSEAPATPPAFVLPRTLGELQAFAASVASGAFATQALDEPEEAPAPPPPAPAPRLAYAPALEEREALRELVRDTLEDIGSLASLRQPIPTETWLDQAPFEQRLLDNLDYVASLGSLGLPQVTLYHHEASVPDVARAFAVAFTLGCIEGADTVDTALAVLKQSPPEEWPGFVEGFTLAPSPHIDAALTELLRGPNVGLAGVALEVLGARGTLPRDAAECVLFRNDASLVGKLARALGTNLSQADAVAALRTFFREDTDDALFLATAASLLQRDQGFVRDWLRAALSSRVSAARADGAAVLLALAGGPDDLSLLVGALGARPTPALARALGRFGHLEAVPALISLLAQGDKKLAEAAGEALDRMTAAGLRHTIEEPWGTGLPPELQRHADEAGAPAPMRNVEKVVLDVSVWSNWARQRLPSLDRTRKHRGGQPFLPMHLVEELEAPTTPPVRREETARELSLVLPDGHRFSPGDWVAKQQAQLSELRRRASALGSLPGAWVFGGHPTLHPDSRRASRGR